MVNPEVTPHEQKGQEQHELRRAGPLVQKPGAAPKQKHRRRVHAPLFEQNQRRTFPNVLRNDAQPQPQGVEKPGDRPETEVAALGVPVQVEKNTRQHADGEKRVN